MERRLSLKKPAIITGLVLSLMLAALAGTTFTNAHAAPASNNHYKPSAAVLAAAKKAEKANHHSSSCSHTSSNFQASPCSVREDSAGNFSSTLAGKNLIAKGLYLVYSPALFNACPGAVAGTTNVTINGTLLANTGNAVFVDLDGKLNATVHGGPNCSKGNFPIELVNTGVPNDSYGAVLTITGP